jgi:ribonuclease Y
MNEGRIIGREGRKLRTLETLSESISSSMIPGAVVISCFDPIRKETARFLTLITDGRIHPERIEEIVQKVSKEINQTVTRRGRRRFSILESQYGFRGIRASVTPHRSS